MRFLNLQTHFALDPHRQRGRLFRPEALKRIESTINRAAESIEARRGRGPLAFLDLPLAYDPSLGPTGFGDVLVQTAPRIHEAAARVRRARGQYVHLGIGGSALGAITLVEALGEPSPAESGVEVHIPNNVDPEQVAAILRRLDPRRTFLNVVSKSGGTVEALANFAVILDFLRSSDLSATEVRERVFITTDPERGALRDMAAEEGFELFPLPHSVHGRFSVLSPAGLLTAAVAGVDVEALLAGAREADEATAGAPFEDNPSRLLAALHFLGNTEMGLTNLVLLPYSHRLRSVADWYSQLVAESLGKEGKGMTPVKALGATDQHSQLQLYNDGPKDKLVVVFGVEAFRTDLEIPASISRRYEFLAGHSLGDLLNAERQATELSLNLHGVPSCSVLLPRIEPRSVGALFTVLEKTICILGELYEVNAFDQPGVEESKAYARAMLGQAGEENERLREVVREHLGEPKTLTRTGG